MGNTSGIRRLQAALESEDSVFTTGLILQELLQGFSTRKSRNRILASFASLPLIIPERKDHVEAAALKVRLPEKGVQAGTIDALIAQLCVRYGFWILTLDADFSHMARFIPLRIL